MAREQCTLYQAHVTLAVHDAYENKEHSDRSHTHLWSIMAKTRNYPFITMSSLAVLTITAQWASTTWALLTMHTSTKMVMYVNICFAMFTMRALGKRSKQCGHAYYQNIATVDSSARGQQAGSWTLFLTIRQYKQKGDIVILVEKKWTKMLYFVVLFEVCR